MEALASSLDYRVTLTRVAELAVPELADWCTVDILDPESAAARQIAVAHVDPKKVAFAREIGERYPPDQNEKSGVAQVMESGKSRLYTEIPSALVEAAARDAHHLSILQELKLESAMVVPLRSASGRTLGAMTFVYADSGRRYGEDDLSFAEDFARRAVMAIENARAVTEVEAARAREQAMREQAELASTAKRIIFLATVSHELRTPLNVILGWAVVLRWKRARRAPREFQQALAVIERNARAQARLIEDVLDVSRITSGKLALSLAAVNVAQALRTAVEGMRPAADAKAIVLNASSAVDELALTITADADRLQQILWNHAGQCREIYAKRCRRHSRVGRARRLGRARSSERQRRGHPAPEYCPTCSSRSSKPDSSTTRRHGGLPSAWGSLSWKQIAAAHGGTVEASSPGEGHGAATFTVWLPARSVPVSVARASWSRASGARRSWRSGRWPLGRGCSVLVVDDELDAREHVVESLQDAGATVDKTESVSRALRELDAHRPAILVSDIGMPYEDGYALARKIRALPAERGGQIPALALTAYAAAADAQRAFDAGFQRHVAKPVDPLELVEIVAELAGRARAQRPQ